MAKNHNKDELHACGAGRSYLAPVIAALCTDEFRIMISRIVAFILILIIGYTLYGWFSSYWFSVPLAVIAIASAIASILPNQYQSKSSVFLKSVAFFLLAFGAFLLYQRLEFMAINEGMEGPEGQGSPMAFLIGFVFEQVFFTLPSIYILWAYSAKRVKRWVNA